jgi:hypothetical protein
MSEQYFKGITIIGGGLAGTITISSAHAKKLLFGEERNKMP